MSRTFGLVAAAALLAGATAFAQTSAPQPQNPSAGQMAPNNAAESPNGGATAAPSNTMSNMPSSDGSSGGGSSSGMSGSDQTSGSNANMSGSSADASDASGEKTGKMRHGHHNMKTAGQHGRDTNADKLNACMANAVPTASQEECLKQAESDRS